MTLAEIRRNLEELGVRSSRRLGQNFLYDQNVARRIVDLADIQKGENVVEIGPGLGALTEFILKREPGLTLIERDHRLAEFLGTRFPMVQVIRGDALEEITNYKLQIANCLVMGNLPYSIASPLMVRLCEVDLRPARMLFTIQQEVAKRLVAHPRTHDHGLLTLLTQPFYEIRILRKVPSTVFWPRPEVTSAVVGLTRRTSQPFVSNPLEQRFRQIIKKAFQKRRKSLGAIFGKELPPFVERSRRPEELSIEEWIRFTRDPGTAHESAFRSPYPAVAVTHSAIGTEEMFDVVNERNEIIRQERRSEVHRQNLLHRAVHVFIRNRRGELLLQKRSSQKDVAPNTWDSSAAGHLAAGEGYDEAAQREVKEELGVSPRLKRTCEFEAHEELGWEFVWLYKGKSEGPFHFPQSEISELRWWTGDEIDQAIHQQPLQFAPSFRHIWQRLKTGC